MQTTRKQAWIIRHGESRGNAGERTDLPATIELTEKGRAEAEQLAASFPGEPDLIVVSPYIRTSQTAEPLRRRFPAVPVEEWPIHEFTYLPPEAYRTTTQQEREIPSLQYWTRCDPEENLGQGAESFTDFIGRMVEFRRRIFSSDARKIAVFCHGYVVKAIIWTALWPPPSGRPPSNAYMAGFRGLHYGFPVRNADVFPLEVVAEQIFVGSRVGARPTKDDLIRNEE